MGKARRGSFPLAADASSSSPSKGQTADPVEHIIGCPRRSRYMLGIATVLGFLNISLLIKTRLAIILRPMVRYAEVW